MTRFRIHVNHWPIFGYFVIMGNLRQATIEDPVDLFWHLLAAPTSPYTTDEEINQTERNIVAWLFENRIDFRVEIEGSFVIDYDESGTTDYYETAAYWIVICNPDHEMLFKLRWGGR